MVFPEKHPLVVVMMELTAQFESWQWRWYLYPDLPMLQAHRLQKETSKRHIAPSEHQYTPMHTH